MRGRTTVLTGAVCLVLCGLRLEAQAPDSTGASQAAAGSVVPRLVQFNGVVKDASGKPTSGAVAMTFSLYELQTGGTPLWSETQTLTLDDQGHYSVLLGASSVQGLPLDLFTSGAAKWLGVQPQVAGIGEEPRVLLVGVPYALKAADADTLGGKPASAYVTTETSNARSGPASAAPASVGLEALAQTLSAPQAGSAPSSVNPLTSPCASITADGTATANFVAKFSAPCVIHQSAVFENSGNVGIGNASPAGKLDVSGNTFLRGTLQSPPTGTATTTNGFNSQPHDWVASALSSSSGEAVRRMRRRPTLVTAFWKQAELF